ncbi:ATP synthase subunit delta, mitochondrial, partial [Geodia barretti]
DPEIFWLALSLPSTSSLYCIVCAHSTASSGTVTVNADGTVQILAEEAYPLDMFDAQAARQGLDKCKQQRSSASSDAERAEADIGIELYENLIKALE